MGTATSVPKVRPPSPTTAANNNNNNNNNIIDNNGNNSNNNNSSSQKNRRTVKENLQNMENALKNHLYVDFSMIAGEKFTLFNQDSMAVKARKKLVKTFLFKVFIVISSLLALMEPILVGFKPVGTPFLLQIIVLAAASLTFCLDIIFTAIYYESPNDNIHVQQQQQQQEEESRRKAALAELNSPEIPLDSSLPPLATSVTQQPQPPAQKRPSFGAIAPEPQLNHSELHEVKSTVSLHTENGGNDVHLTPFQIFLAMIEGEVLLDFFCLVFGWATIFVNPGLAALRCLRVFRFLFYFELFPYYKKADFDPSTALFSIRKASQLCLVYLKRIAQELFTQESKGGIVIISMWLYLTYLLGVVFWVDIEHKIHLSDDTLNESECSRLNTCFFTFIRLSFYDGNGFDFMQALMHEGYGGYATLCFIYMIISAIILLNGLIGIFGGAFSAADDDSKADSNPNNNSYNNNNLNNNSNDPLTPGPLTAGGGGSYALLPHQDTFLSLSSHRNPQNSPYNIQQQQQSLQHHSELLQLIHSLKQEISHLNGRVTEMHGKINEVHQAAFIPATAATSPSVVVPFGVTHAEK